MSPPPLRTTSILALCIILVPTGAHSAQRPGEPYESPFHDFSVVIPAFAFGTHVQKDNDKTAEMLSVLGDMGDVRLIDYQRLPPGFPPPADSAMMHDFGQEVLDDLLRANPGAILNEERIPIDTQDTWFALVTFTHGSRVVDSTGQRRDATRGLLVFMRHGMAYTLHAEDGVMAGPLEATRAKEILTAFYRSITFR